MPDAPISTTPFLGLGQWADKKKPGADALNNNWLLIDSALQAVQTALDGIDISGKASQSDLDALSASVTALEAAITAANYVKADGTVSMAGNLQFDGFKGVNVSAGTDPGDIVNRAQLDAAVAAGLGSLSGSYAYCLVKTSVDLDDAATGETSPKTFIGDTNTVCTPAGLHSTSSNKTRFVATQDGFYMLNARMKVQGFGGATLTWWKNGGEAVESVMPAVLHDVGLNVTFITDVLLIKLSAGDYVELKVYGLVSGTGTIMASSSISMLLLSANAVGGGDLKSDGSVPMVDPFDNGGQQSKNGADATDPTDLTTLQQVEAIQAALEAEIAAIVVPPAVPAYTKAAASRTIGNVSAPGAVADISGLTVTVAHAGGILEARFSAALSVAAFSIYTAYINVNGTDYPFAVLNQINGSRGDNTVSWPANAMIALDLPAGTYTVKARHSGVNATLLAAAPSIASLVVDYVA